MEKKTYSIISGGVYEVEADSGKEALDKYYAYDNGSPCPCKADDCDCVGFMEADTILINADPEDLEA
jgi:hypothetical protein